MPCLATRFPYGTALTYKEMERVEQGEAYLRGLGLNNVRIRVHGTIARVEVDEGAFGEVIKRKNEIISFLQYRSHIINYIRHLGYPYITLDLEGFRSGSMDVGLKSV